MENNKEINLLDSWLKTNDSMGVTFLLDDMYSNAEDIYLRYKIGYNKGQSARDYDRYENPESIDYATINTSTIVNILWNIMSLDRFKKNSIIYYLLPKNYSTKIIKYLTNESVYLIKVIRKRLYSYLKNGIVEEKDRDILYKYLKVLNISLKIINKNIVRYKPRYRYTFSNYNGLSNINICLMYRVVDKGNHIQDRIFKILDDIEYKIKTEERKLMI